MKTENFFQIMKDKTQIFVNRWICEDEENIKGVVVLSHGMLEHSLRYDRIGYLFSENGFIFCAHDHRGHGKTANNAIQNETGVFGKLADKNGFETVVSDLDEIIDEVKKDFPEKKIILLGHSFGSVVAQRYIELHGDKINACILSGTSTSTFRKKLGLSAFEFLSFFVGNRHSAFLQKKVFFSGFLSHIKNPSSSNAWLSKNESNVMMYENDNWCGNIATISFLKDILKGLSITGKQSQIAKIPKTLPLFFIAGTEDPVGNYTKNIKKLISLYKNNGISNITECFIKDDRHEIYNEKDGDENVLKTIKWIESLS